MSLLRNWAAILAAAASLLGCGSDGADALSNGLGGRQSPAGPTEEEQRPELPEGAFAYGNAPTLLPFDVRLAKVARVLDVDTASPVLEALRARRLDLGDHD